MALQGTIRDFGLGDIFQLIGIQRKTGVLTLGNGEETVTVQFKEGQVVGADMKERSVEDLLGAVLVRTGRITEANLQEALRTQRKTLQRLGYVLVRNQMISEDDLVEALRIQSLQIVYRLFRWRAGDYNFLPADNVDYDEQHFMPISAETILMEGARMIDEWPIIERRIKSNRMVLRRTTAAEALELSVESLVDRDIEIDFGFAKPDPEPEPESDAGAELKLSPEEMEVLALIDGSRTVEEINDRSSLGEFDTWRILADLMTRNLLEEVRRVTAANGPGRGAMLAERFFQGLMLAVVFGAVTLGLIGLPQNRFTPWQVLAGQDSLDRLKLHASQARIERVERAIQVFYLDAGTFPDSVDLLAANGYLPAADLVDPWGQAYVLRLYSGGYQILGWTAEGEISELLTVSHRFSPFQRSMFDRAQSEPAE